MGKKIRLKFARARVETATLDIEEDAFRSMELRASNDFVNPQPTDVWCAVNLAPDVPADAWRPLPEFLTHVKCEILGPQEERKTPLTPEEIERLLGRYMTKPKTTS